jgi:hypothetical protein
MTDRLPHEKGFHVSWDQIHRDARALAWRLQGRGPGEDGAWKAVVGITRGGLVPAMTKAKTLTLSWWGFNGDKLEEFIVQPVPAQRMRLRALVFETGNNADRLNR